jgi:hypothetical protein
MSILQKTFKKLGRQFSSFPLHFVSYQKLLWVCNHEWKLLYMSMLLYTEKVAAFHDGLKKFSV